MLYFIPALSHISIYSYRKCAYPANRSHRAGYYTKFIQGRDDWEFAGMNDPIYDIACYGNAGFDKALSLLEAYVGHKPTSDELKRLYFHRSFQCLQWYNVAIFKDRVGLSRDLNMDFNAVAAFFFNMAKDLASKYNTL